MRKTTGRFFFVALIFLFYIHCIRGQYSAFPEFKEAEELTLIKILLNKTPLGKEIYEESNGNGFVGSDGVYKIALGWYDIFGRNSVLAVADLVRAVTANRCLPNYLKKITIEDLAGILHTLYFFGTPSSPDFDRAIQAVIQLYLEKGKKDKERALRLLYAWNGRVFCDSLSPVSFSLSNPSPFAKCTFTVFSGKVTPLPRNLRLVRPTLLTAFSDNDSRLICVDLGVFSHALVIKNFTLSGAFSGGFTLPMSSCVAVSSDAQILGMYDEGIISAYFRDGLKKYSYSWPGLIAQMAISQDGNSLVYLDVGGEAVWCNFSCPFSIKKNVKNAFLYRVNLSTPPVFNSTSSVAAFAQHATTAFQFPSVKVWDISLSKIRSTGDHDHDIELLSFTPDDNQIISHDGKYLYFWSMANLIYPVVKKKTGCLMSIAPHPTQPYLAAITAKKEIKLFDFNGKVLFSLPLKKKGLKIVFNHSGNSFAVLCEDGIITLYDTVPQTVGDLCAQKFGYHFNELAKIKEEAQKK